jgi:uncharacterized protein (TIGR03437 family)
LTAGAQTITTVAGNGIAGYSGDGAQALSAALNHPSGIALDASGNIFIADQLNHRIRRVGLDGTIITVAGTGLAGFSGDGGLAVNSQLNNPEGVLVDASSNLYIADSANHRIRKVTPDGTISTFAGTGTFGFNGDSIAAVNAQLNHPTGMVMDISENLYIADSSNQRIRKVATNGIITTVAGNGIAGYSGDGGLGTSATMRFPIGLALDSATGRLFIADAGNHVVRELASSGILTTIAGNGQGAGSDQGSFSGDNGSAILAGLNTPAGVAVDAAGGLYIADSGNNRIRKVTGGTISTIAGSGIDGFSGDGGVATLAQMTFPGAVVLASNGNLLISDELNNRIRQVTYGAATLGPPVVFSGAVVNGASFRKSTDPNGAIAAGAIVSLFGQDLATGATQAASIPLPANLAGTSVNFNGVVSPLFYVSSSQVNVQVPFNTPNGSLSVQVTRNGVAGPAQAVSMALFSPGIFTTTSTGSGPGAILHADTFASVSTSAPARRGEFIAIFCTGLGPVQPPVPSGSVAPSFPLSQTTFPVTASIGGLPAQVSFAGLAPSFVGLYQVNAQVPTAAPAGDTVALILTIGGITSNTVTIAVQ